ncbi:hypothetical protein GCM10010277_79450 [Streptomyces longisporoflavus]|nr:hypothetical protein GCM10010277_79450 [Streptomyces longisporoflavus]
MVKVSGIRDGIYADTFTVPGNVPYAPVEKCYSASDCHIRRVWCGLHSVGYCRARREATGIAFEPTMCHPSAG